MITYCPSCDTYFRVHAYQLAARGGQVRCGKCDRVFDALEHLIEEIAPNRPPRLPHGFRTLRTHAVLPEHAPEPAAAEIKEVSGEKRESQGDQDQARRLEEEAKSFTALLKSQGYAVRIARQLSKTVKPASGGSYSVLVVDNTPMLSSTVCKFLELKGYAPRLASNRDEVVAALRKSPAPDLILLDMMLPDVSGFDILMRVRSHPMLRHIPIIMITAKVTREDVMRALAAGANGYITKPFELATLMSSVKAVLGIGIEPPPEG